MINQHRGINEIDRFVKIKNISLNLDSEVFYAHWETDKWQLYDIYRTALSPRGRLIVGIVNETLYGKWGLRSWKYDKRTDLHNLTLNVINVANPYGRAGLNTSERRLSGRELVNYLKSFEVYNVDTMAKFSYAAFEPLMKIFNFSVRLRSTNSWGYKLNGSWDGMIKALVQGRADISGTAAYKTDRLDVIDYTSVTLWLHKPCFTFLHPTGSQDNLTLLRPFSFTVWCSLVGMLVLSVLTFYLIVKYEHFSSQLKTNSILANVLLINIAAYCQQSFYVQPTKLAGRVIFILVFFFGTLLYQFYSSSIVASLLHQPVKNIDSLEKLANSRFKIGIEDSVNVRLLTKELSMINPTMENILGIKNDSRRLKAEYVLNAEGVAKVKKGGYAFFTDTATSYWFMGKLFSEKEKCELTEISLTKPSRGSMMLRKRSPYKKLFSYGYVKLLETGFVNRELRRWHANKPTCMYNKLKSGDAFTSVKLGDILPALANPYGSAGLNTSERRLSGRELVNYLKSYGVFNLDSVSRFSYATFEPLAKMFNFSINLKSSNSWGFKTNGSWDGMIEALIAGIHVQPVKPAGRVIFILVFVVGIFVYQFYSSSSVVSLLRPSVKKIDSLEKIVKSRMKVGIEDSVYLRILANEIAEVNPLMKEILDCRRNSHGQKAEFVLNAEGVEKVMKGNYAFFTDTATSYWFISKLFTESEKCDLAEISITKPNRCSVMLQKKSPYKKLFSYGYIKLLETGFINRELKRWRSSKPICVYSKWKSKESFVGIKFSDIIPALLLLFIGYLISLLIFIIEHFLSLQLTTRFI
ncbi:ionotropic receptor 75a-like [Adelges cooleyi]|uniref:ionotropic receptor 75a-like n=1 Tax=Adelges cooleyi TaxID=133065 RepID=UPI002180748E|nr:ionotropic receptor 75a-like [Adelges cooleyi]